MRSVRCNACGTKALTAASQCPKCSHLFEVRDGFGALLPLAYCSSCDSYYPVSVGSCQWCGTTPAPAPIAPKVWKGVGIAALAVFVVGAWLMRDSRPKGVEHIQMTAAVTPDTAPAPADTATPLPVIAPVDTTVAPITAVASVSAESSPAPSARPAEVIVPQAGARAVASTKAFVKTGVPKGRPSSRWISSISRNWVVVRAGASKGSRIVASIGPDSRVQLGESRGGWRRIKAKGIAGWADPRSSFGVVRRAGKENGIAAR